MNRVFKINGREVTITRQWETVTLEVSGVVMRQSVESNIQTAERCEQWVYMALIEMERIAAKRGYDPSAPNASHYSARYAERKRARERAFDATVRHNPCLHCNQAQLPGSLFCADHAAEYKSICDSTSDISDTRWQKFTQRTYWPK